MSNSIKRVLFGIFAIPTSLFVIYKGSYFLLFTLAFMVFVGTKEILNIFQKKQIYLPKILYFLNLGVFFSFSLLQDHYWLLSIILVFVIICGINLFQNRLDGAIIKISFSIFSSIYVGVFFACVYKIWQINSYYLGAVFLMIWTTDSFAYFVGMSFGKKRGVIKASPKKSIEGFVGGFVFCFIMAFLLVKIFPDIFSFNIMIILAVLVGVFAQLGDLFESVFKRDAGVKDSGNIFPGHGGVLDRFDSLLLVGPIVYVVLKLLQV